MVANTLSADLFLIHAPSVYDFRERDDVLFAYLSDSDSVNVTSIFEMYPLGFLNMKAYLKQYDIQTEIVNLASLMLKRPTLDVEGLIKRLQTPVFGLDLHWMAQSHGAIEVAKLIRKIHPEALIIFGGISSTYFADELIRYSCVDVIFQGFDTLEPLRKFMAEVKRGGRNFKDIPNLIYKQNSGEIIKTGFIHKPTSNYNDATVDWSFYREAANSPMTTKLIMTLPNSGCAMDCQWCGGSRYSYQNIMGVKKSLIQKDMRHIVDELRTLGDAAKSTSIYALQCYSENDQRFSQYLDVVKEMEYKSASFELFHLPKTDMLKKMGKSTQSFIMLSPESHDPVISKLAGRGNYTMAEMEAWIPKALDAGVAGIMVWFFIGMPQQTPQSVMDTVTYSKRLLDKFKGGTLIPIICPMVPFLDPGSRFFEEPKKHGYRLFHKTLEEHRNAMVAPLWHQRLNYETKWLSRHQIQDITYQAVSELVAYKAELGILPTSIAQHILKRIAETQDLLFRIENTLDKQSALPTELRSEIREYNREIFAFSSDQLIPVKRPFGGRWFDDFTVPEQMLNEICNPI